MQQYFYELSQKLFKSLTGDEVLLLNYEAENSDFARFNHNKIRQAGFVGQQQLSLNLIAAKKQCTATFNLCGDPEQDMEQAKHILHSLRDRLEVLPVDPYLYFSTDIHNSEFFGENNLPDSERAIDEIVTSADGLDLVGIWASGSIVRGFANSLGQTNWHSTHNFNFDWSVYHHTDKAIKMNYAGFEWQRDFLQAKLDFARQTLPILEKPAKTIKPGKYRVFLTPGALQELIDMLNWGGFGLKSHRTLQTPLLKMITEDQQLDKRLSLIENHEEGLAPCFTSSGFIKPKNVEIIVDGAYRDCLVDPRSAQEFNENVNCDHEQAQSLEMRSGKLHQDKILETLDTGIYISNLWYCNYSDRNHCRITGMTRFACLWVENGVPVAPLNVMRFDESIYHVLGENLIDLTIEHEHILDSGSYGKRSINSSRLPGILADNFSFTL